MKQEESYNCVLLSAPMFVQGSLDWITLACFMYSQVLVLLRRILNLMFCGIDYFFEGGKK